MRRAPESNEVGSTDLQYVNALPGNMTIDLILLVKVTTKHLSRLVDSMFNLDGNTTTSLGLLHDLNMIIEPTEPCLAPREKVISYLH